MLDVLHLLFLFDGNNQVVALTYVRMDVPIIVSSNYCSRAAGRCTQPEHLVKAFLHKCHVPGVGQTGISESYGVAAHHYM